MGKKGKKNRKMAKLLKAYNFFARGLAFLHKWCRDRSHLLNCKF